MSGSSNYGISPINFWREGLIPLTPTFRAFGLS
jgi:hypothetical protein